ncbi:hypothetical protein E2C01_021788 [Portunus trituberculatus]|uniref:Uncharacterized protein n=1 Tax=Portunus trituberculatus TaxID=210409 RepID=A0A5B7E594_PORTR|nr:hypothetical protein [Portunus trituberculatus]
MRGVGRGKLSPEAGVEREGDRGRSYTEVSPRPRQIDISPYEMNAYWQLALTCKHSTVTAAASQQNNE